MSRAPFRLAPLDVTMTMLRLSVAQSRWIATCGSKSRKTFAIASPLADEQRIAGYYTLASASLLLADLPSTSAKKLPRYPTVPAVRMGRLAVDQAFKRRGLGGALLADALDFAARPEIAAYALMVDAKDEAAAAFYRHHGFIALPDLPLTLFLPMATALASRKTGKKIR